jgi:mannosyltransferase OCH1-like enzyme
MLTKKHQNNVENIKLILYNQPYTFFKSYYNSIIPLKIYQTWYTKDLPPKMKENVELLKQQNPRFEHHLFDDNDCREFIKTNFEEFVLNAYDGLIPGAYKADLWRYCVLYINGGIYMDIKLSCINGFKLIELTENEHYARDRIPPLTIYNAIMVCKAGNPFLWKAIYRIVINVSNKYYGNSSLDPTGPEMLGKIILRNNIPLNIDLKHYLGEGYVIYKNIFVFSTIYSTYNEERAKMNNSINKQRYTIMWDNKNIYHI